MKDLFFVNLINDIWDVAKHYNIPVQSVFDTYYNKMIEGKVVSSAKDKFSYDFGAIKATWDTYPDERKDAALFTYNAFISANYEKISELWENDDKSGVKAIAIETENIQ